MIAQVLATILVSFAIVYGVLVAIAAVILGFLWFDRWRRERRRTRHMEMLEGTRRPPRSGIGYLEWVDGELTELYRLERDDSFTVTATLTEKLTREGAELLDRPIPNQED